MAKERIAHFEILDELGLGGMGRVYRARDERLGRQVALKTIRPEKSAGREARRRFLEECRATAALTHPSVATLYEAGETGEGELWFAAELVEGETLRERLARERLSWSESLDLGLELAEGLAAAHRRGVIHRDVKPANLMVTPDGHLKILDFGVARLGLLAEEGEEDTETRTVTREGVVVGSPAYMSPEQATGEAVDARSDVFSAGLILYEMACGRPAFGPGEPSTIMRRIVTVDPTPPREVDPAIPPALAEIITRCLAKEKDRRFRSGAELSAALRQLRGEASGLQPATIPSPGRRRLALALLVLAALAAVALTAVFRMATRPTFAFESRDLLLVADVDNQAGEPAFELALRTALMADLGQSRHVNIFDESQVARTLVLMRRAPGTPVDEALGRDICRFAGVRALLLPRVVAVGEAYDLQADLVDPHTGRRVDRFRATAASREAVLLETVDELAGSIRSRLGESLEEIERSDAPVADLTTSSWEALEHFALGTRLWYRGKHREGADHLERALEEDPRFASARAGLGLLLVQYLDERERGQEMLRQALVDSEEATERERLHIRALNLQFVEGDLEGALREYRLLADEYPDFAPAQNNIGMILRRLGRPREAIDRFEEAASVDPTNPIYLKNSFWAWLGAMNDPVQAESVGRRLVVLDEQDADSWHFHAWSLVALRRYAEAEEAIVRARELETDHRFALPNHAHLLLRRGAADEALPLYRRMAELAEQGRTGGTLLGNLLSLAVVLAETDRQEECEALLERIEREVHERAAGGPGPADRLLLARVALLRGEAGEAEALLASVLSEGGGSAEVLFAAARASALLGRREEVLELLAAAFEAGFWDRYYPLIDPGFRSLDGDGDLYRLLRGGPGSGPPLPGSDS
jgi:tetratricopeptide (TPR) repeat protein